MPSERREFNRDVKERLAVRVCYKCSRCRCPTAGPSADESGRVMIGVAAHICAASRGGPRFDPAQSEEERRSIRNGIWLCASCAKLIDDDVTRFSVSELHRIKIDAERRAAKELALPPNRPGIHDWQSSQTSKISSYGIPLRFEIGEHGALPFRLEEYSDGINHVIFWAFSHTCMTTPFDDFVYVLSFEQEQRETEPGYISFTLTLHCHITAFVWAFEKLARHFIEGDRQPSGLYSLPGEQKVEVGTQLGRFIPTRVCRTGATSVSIQQCSDKRIGLDGPVTTSTLLRVLAASVNNRVLIWDDADLCPDFQKLMSMLVKIDAVNGFSWSDFRIDRADPEKWQYVGPR